MKAKLCLKRSSQLFMAEDSSTINPDQRYGYHLV